MQFQQRAKQALKNKSKRLIKKLEKTMEHNSKYILKLLRTRANGSGAAYSDGQSVGVYANKNSQESAKKWRSYKDSRSSKDGYIAYVFRNDAKARHNKYPYVKRIYKNEFRSKKLSETRWLAFRKYILTVLKSSVRHEIKGIA